MRLADLVKVSRADLAWLYPREDPEAAASRWLGSGPALVLVTMGGDGAVAFGVAARAGAATPPVTVVDTVGAGDAFTSAALAWLHRHDALHRRGLETLDASALTALLRFANAIAAETCTRAGADPPWGR